MYNYFVHKLFTQQIFEDLLCAGVQILPKIFRYPNIQSSFIQKQTKLNLKDKFLKRVSRLSGKP